ncbi:MAG: PocR ligand-binding domain-containing protein, partial [Sedimentisphaerales bacterium]|nr:PocR ligand-binding domain-containing protein [Sedimentisphaerales bacterium]
GQGSTETIFKCKNGDLIDILLTASLLVQNDPDKGITFAATDISKQKALASALEKRILALTQPLENIGNISFHDLFNLDDIQKIQDHFANSTGVASIITDIDGNPITRPSNFCRLCNDIIRKTEKGCANCCKSDAALGRVCNNGPTIQPCLSGGLWDAGASITVGGKHIANWLIGQVRDQSQSEDKIADYARQIGADVEETLAAFAEVTQMPFEKFQTISQTLYLMAKQLSDSAYQNIQQARFIAESKKNHQIINNYNETLRSEVARQTRELAQANQQLNIIIEEQKTTEAQLRDTHEHLVQSEKLASIGQLAAGVAHEINSPLGAIASSNTAIRDNFEDITFALHEMSHIFTYNVELTHRLLHYIMIHEESVISTRQQRQLRMTIAQELKGKVSIDLDYLAQFIVSAGLTDCYEQFLPLFNNKDSDKYLESVQKIFYIFQATRVIDQAINQSSRIVFALREYAHSNESEKKQLANIKHSLETAITLYANKLKHGVELILNFNDTPDIACFPGELNQVWTNLIHNAVQAMEGKGILRISLDQKDNMIEVVVTDSGSGIPDEIKDKIFTPLFTTKPAGMGTGLGLDIVNRIVKRHDGTISFNSIAGQGASFTVRIPVNTSI